VPTSIMQGWVNLMVWSKVLWCHRIVINCSVVIAGSGREVLCIDLGMPPLYSRQKPGEARRENLTSDNHRLLIKYQLRTRSAWKPQQYTMIHTHRHIYAQILRHYAKALQSVYKHHSKDAPLLLSKRETD